MTDSTVEDEPSSSQMLLTPEQKERMARQRELALARRSVALHTSTPPAVFPPQNEELPRALHLLNKVRSSQPLPAHSLTGSTLIPFRKSARKPFLPPVKVIDLEEDGPADSDEVHMVHVHHTKGDVMVSGKPLHKHKSMATFDSVKTYGARPWLCDNKNSAALSIDPHSKRARARREGTTLRRRRERSSSDDPSNDDGWISVRKRSLTGHIFGHVNPETHNQGSVFDNPKVMDALPHKSSSFAFFRKPQGKLNLSSQQRKVLLAISAGKSVFLTGSAGTGKSYVLQEAVYIMKNMYGPDCVFVTASTGLAACAIGGTTLHSFAGIGLGIGERRELANKVSTKRDARKRWMDCKALIIDEISMIDGELFDKLEYVARVLRGPAYKNQVFGGIQLVVTGDFFQLPPVQPENPEKYFAFQADCWNDCFQLQVELTQVFRQSDSEFVTMLNEIRKGQCSSLTHLKLSACDTPLQSTNTGILMTKLYPRKMDVGKENEQKLRSLNQNTVAFLAKDESKSEFASRQLENVRAVKELYLSVGAQVMLVKNVDSAVGLVNGARGVVTRFASIEELDDGKDLARKISHSGLWPVVLFACDGVERLVRPESWSVMDGNAEVAKRSQIPLILAWALSVHKCQGMTLDRVEIDLSKSFEYGMVYVALSRVKCLDGLRLIGFDPSLIKVHSKVVQFYEELQTGEL